jgi:predicted dehydrogenase
MRTPLSVGVVGGDEQALAYADALVELPQATLRWLCDERDELPQHAAIRFATAQLTHEPGDLLADDDLDALIITSPACADFVCAALVADKHVLASPPLADSVGDAEALVQLAEARGRALVVAEPLVADPASAQLKALIEAGELGELYALHVNAQGLGYAADRQWPFGVDELSLVLHLVDDDPIEVVAHGESFLEPCVVDVALCVLRFATGISAHLHFSWLDPLPIRRFTAIGSKRMAVLDDLAPERKLTVHDRRASRFAGPGDLIAPWIEAEDRIKLECERLVSATRRPASAPAARRAIAVVGVVESVLDSLAMERPPAQVAPLPPRIVPLHIVEPRGA